MRFLKPGMFLRNLKCTSETWNVFWKPWMFLPNLNVFTKPRLFFFKPIMCFQNLDCFCETWMCFWNLKCVSETKNFFFKTWNVLSKPKMCFQNLQCFCETLSMIAKASWTNFFISFSNTTHFTVFLTCNYEFCENCIYLQNFPRWRNSV